MLHGDMVRAGLQGGHQTDQEAAQRLVAEHLQAENCARHAQAHQRSHGHRAARTLVEVRQRVEDDMQRPHHHDRQRHRRGGRGQAERPRQVDQEIAGCEHQRRRRQRWGVPRQAPLCRPVPSQRRDRADRQQHRGRHGKQRPQHEPHRGPCRGQQPSRHPGPPGSKGLCGHLGLAGARRHRLHPCLGPRHGCSGLSQAGARLDRRAIARARRYKRSPEKGGCGQDQRVHRRGRTFRNR